MYRAADPPFRRLTLVTTLGACLLLLGQAPLAHVMSNVRPAAADTPVPVEEEQRSDTAERVWQAQVSLRHRKHVTYQETVEPLPSWELHSHAVVAAAHAISPAVFAGAPRPLRC
jgi:hypothetical protein